MRLRLALAIGAIGLTALSACGSADDEQGAPTTPSFDTTRKAVPASAADIPTTVPAGPFIGKWYAKLTPEQAVGGDVRMAGKFRLALRADGTYTTFQELDGETNGHYRMASGNRLVFKQDDGCDVFTGRRGGSVGVYRWSLNGSHMRLTSVVPETGGCTGRTESLVMPVWQRR